MYYVTLRRIRVTAAAVRKQLVYIHYIYIYIYISCACARARDNTQHRQTSMPPGGIRTHNLSRRAAVDLRRRPRGHWDRQRYCILSTKVNLYYLVTVSKDVRCLQCVLPTSAAPPMIMPRPTMNVRNNSLRPLMTVINTSRPIPS